MEAAQEQMGIENLKEIVDAGLEIQGLVSDIAKDGKVDLGDLPAIIGRIPSLAAKLPPAIKDANLAIPEAKDLSPEEAGLLASHVISKLAVDSEKAQKIVAESLGVMIAIIKLIRAVKA